MDSFDLSDVKHIKFCPRDGTPLPVDEPACRVCDLPVPSSRIPRWGVWVAIPLLTILITSLLAGWNRYVYSTLQPASCTITATWETTPLGHGVYIADPSSDPLTVTYQITNAQDQVLAQGSGDLGLDSDSSAYPKPALSDSDFYNQGTIQLSKTATCWYSTYALPNVTWNQPGESKWLWLWPFGILALLVLLYLCVLRLIIYPWHLAQRGVQTIGTVTDRVVTDRVRYRGGYYYVSFVTFQTRTTPSLTGEAKIDEDLSLGSKQDVRYDSLNPLKNRRVTSYFGTDMAIVYSLGPSLLVLLLLGVFALIVLSAINF
ncbi:MAG: hypothetical protein J2P36_32740 [Ktedonobacteraceae bacterium]|nr:hypothetical protein [Ktedonobacteraceae bacterium]